ncbi:MAG: hypothetical protein ABL916_11500 [Burkholderiaceae bacterium]
MSTQLAMDLGVDEYVQDVEIVLSLQDRAFELIRSGKKKFEFRRKWRPDPCLAYIYRSGKIKGLAARMTLGSPIYGTPAEIGEIAEKAIPGNGVSVEEYLAKTNGGCAIPIVNFCEFRLISLTELRALSFHPPQYFFYLAPHIRLKALLEERLSEK